VSPRGLTVGALAEQLSSRGLRITGARVVAAGIVARVEHARSLAPLGASAEAARSSRLATLLAGVGDREGASTAALEAYVLETLVAAGVAS